MDNIEYNDDGSQMSLNKKSLYSDNIRAVIKGGERALLSFLITKKEKSKGGKIIMLIKRGANLGVSLLVLFLLIGCAGGGITDPDEIGIHAIADSIKTAIENKDTDMFMSNISLDYDDPEGGTYESIHNMAQDMISGIEAAEEMAGSYGANLVVNTSISNLIVFNSTANSDLKLTISAKVFFVTVYSYDITFEVIYQKEGTIWKIISMIEM